MRYTLRLFFITALILSALHSRAQNFEVQAAAFADSMQRAYFTDRGIDGVQIVRGDNGIFRYIVGNYPTREAAEKVQTQLVEKGFRFAAVIDLEAQRALSETNCGYNNGRSAPTLPNGVRLFLFDKDKSAIDAEGRAVLDYFFEKMKATPGLSLRIMGFNDNEGTAAQSEKIASERARNARNYLINKGIRPDRMELEIYGEAYPIYPNKDFDGNVLPENQRWNRRVMLKLK